jgi:thiol-disulfide isomerase/thioredoxin
MSLPVPKSLALKIAGVGIVVLVGIWAGARVHSSRLSASMSAMQPVPAGEGSAPNAGDVAGDLDLVPHVAVKIPARLPDFVLGDRNGKQTPIATWAGKSLVLNFWATWCAPCRREIPLLKSLSSEWGKRGVEVVGVAVDQRDKVAAFADDLKIPYPILVGDQDALDVAAKFGVEAPVFPFTVFTDRRGQVVTLYIGELHKAQVDLILLAVQNVNDNQVGLAEAQRNIALGLRALAADRAG